MRKRIIFGILLFISFSAGLLTCPLIQKCDAVKAYKKGYNYGYEAAERGWKNKYTTADSMYIKVTVKEEPK